MPQKEKTEKYTLEEVPTQTGIFIKDNSSGDILDDRTVLLTILNDLDLLKNAVVK